MKHGFIQAAAAVVAAVFLCAGSAGAAEFQGRISAKSAILVDADSGRVLFEKNADERSLIASTTKIMTGLLVCEAGDLAREISVPPEAAGVEGSSLYLKAGERITVKELLYGLMLRSGNDAAVALAIATAGSVDAFVKRDLRLAEWVERADDTVDQYFDEVKQSLIEKISKHPEDGAYFLDCLMIAKYFERIADHAVNIAQWVVFSVTGVHKEGET